MTEQASFVTVVDTALDRYVARAPFYIGSAAAIAVVGTAIICFGKLESSETQVLGLALIATLHAIVAIGTATPPSDQRLSKLTIVSRSLRKWPEILLCQLVVGLIETVAILTLFDTSIISAIALVPVSIAWGAVSLCDVTVALDEPAPSGNFFMSLIRRTQFLGGAITSSLAYAFQLRHIGRMASLAIIQVPCVLLLLFIQHQTEIHHVTINLGLIAFWISCAIDGVYEAIFTQTLQRLRAA